MTTRSETLLATLALQQSPDIRQATVDRAFAAERRATVERIREAYSAGIIRPEIAERDRVLAILDQAAR